MTSETTARANAFVQARLPEARDLGGRLVELIEDPEAFVAALATGLERLADPAYRDAQAFVAPGADPAIGVRRPLLDAVAAPVRRALADRSPPVALYLAERLARTDQHEVRGFALVALERSLPEDAERSWQLIRRLARAARDWIAVDTLAHLVAQGILREPRRWAEVEQLVYSPDRWERRLAAAAVAVMPFEVRTGHRTRLVSHPGLTVVESLMGDREPDVQKALSWALRSWREVDPAGVEALLERETQLAVTTQDGHRAWVVRDAHTGRGSSPALAEHARARLAHVRRRPGSPGTSAASTAVATFLAGRGMNTDLPVDGERMQR